MRNQYMKESYKKEDFFLQRGLQIMDQDKLKLVKSEIRERTDITFLFGEDCDIWWEVQFRASMIGEQE